MYTHIVKRDSGYAAGWFGSEQEASIFAAECNREVPGDPAHVEALEPWPDEPEEEEYDHSRAKEDARNAWQHGRNEVSSDENMATALRIDRHLRRNVTI